MKLLNNTRKKVVALAVASAFGGVAMMSAPAHAMNVAQDGKGEVLLFPYYTVKNGYDTLLSVINTSDRTTLFKIRFREARNSREVRDFNVALSPHDVWNGVVTINGTDGALIRTFDKSCTSPPLPAGPNGSGQIDFSSIGYDGTDVQFPYDNGGRNLSRVQEGYFEIIEMAHSTVPESAITAAATIEYATQHVAGVPRACSTFDAAFLNAANLTNGATGSGAFSTFTAPANVLVGNATLINIGSGQAYDATPTAIQAFQDSNTIIFVPGGTGPSLGDGEDSLIPNPAVTAFSLVDGVPTTSTIASRAPVIPTSVDAVSTLLMAESLINEYASGSTATSGAKTDWVVTYPTKHHYTDDGLDAPVPPFAELFETTGQSCDPISLSIYDREEKTQVTVGQNQFSPAPTGPGGVSLCNEVNVLTFNNAALLGSGVQLSVDTSTVGTSGWANLRLTGTAALTGRNGLPAIGFAAIGRNNSVEAGNNRNYGSGSEHARTVTPGGV